MKKSPRKINQLRAGGFIQGELCLEFAPGRYVLGGELGKNALKAWVFCKVEYDPQTQQFAPIGISMGGFYMRVPDILRDLEVPNKVGETVLYRLYHAGFVKGRKLAPGMLELDIQSLADHFQNCRDPEFWTKERRLRYSRALI